MRMLPDCERLDGGLRTAFSPRPKESRTRIVHSNSIGKRMNTTFQTQDSGIVLILKLNETRIGIFIKKDQYLIVAPIFRSGNLQIVLHVPISLYRGLYGFDSGNEIFAGDSERMICR